MFDRQFPQRLKPLGFGLLYVVATLR